MAGGAVLPRRWLRAALAWLHLWVGLSVGTVFAVIGLSGSALVFHEELLHWQHPQLARFEPVADPGVLAAIVERGRDAGLTAVQFPSPTMPTWIGFHSDGRRVHFSPVDGAVVLDRTEDGDALLWLHELHTHLLGGETGEAIAGIVGWISLGLMLTGLYLWWPRAGRMLAQLRVHRGPPIRRWLTWHRSSGVLLFPLLLLSTLTGVGMVYHEAAHALLTTLFGGTTAAPAPSAPAVPVDWRRVVAAAGTALPETSPTRVAVPSAAGAAVLFRVRHVDEWHPNGRSTVAVAGDGTVLQTQLAPAQPAGSRASHAIYPLHIGVPGGGVLRWFTFVAGLLPAFLLATGFLFWRRRKAARAAR